MTSIFLGVAWIVFVLTCIGFSAGGDDHEAL